MRPTPAPEDPAETPLGEVLDFMKLLWRLDHALQTASKRMAASLGVTGPQRLVLRVVGRFPGITPGETAAILRLHPSTITLVVDGLERAGFVARSGDPADRRRTRLRATAAGKAVVRRAAGTVEGAMRRTLARVSVGEREAAARLLSGLAAELEAPTARGASRRAPRRG